MPFTIPVNSDVPVDGAKTGFTIPADPPGILSRVGTDLSKRWAEGQDAASQYNEGKITAPEMLLRSTGKVVGGSVSDVLGEGVKSAISETPDFIKKPISGAISSIANTDIGKAGMQAAKRGADAYKKFATENPRAAADLESAGDIAGILAGAKPGAKVLTESANLAGEGAAVTGKAMQKAGSAVSKAGEEQAAKQKASFVRDLVSPKQTASVKEAQVGRTTERGLLNKSVVEPTPLEKQVAEEVSKLPVSKSNSMQKNYNIIQKANKEEAESLQKLLKAKDVPVEFSDVQGMISKTMADLSKNPYLASEGKEATLRVIQGMNKAILDNAVKDGKITASNLLQARKDFDTWAKSQRPKVFNPASDSAVSTAVGEVRQALNDLIEAKVPDAQFKASLKKQSNLYRAMDNLEKKIPGEAKNAGSRLVQKAENMVPLKNNIAKGAALVGIPLPALSHPAIAAGLLGAYGAGHVLASPTAKKAVGGVLQGAGKFLENGINTGTPLSGIGRKIP